jgi:hypothetical protein
VPTIATSESTSSLSQTKKLTDKAVNAVAILPSNLSELRNKVKSQKNSELNKASMEEQVQMLEAFRSQMDNNEGQQTAKAVISRGSLGGAQMSLNTSTSQQEDKKQVKR